MKKNFEMSRGFPHFIRNRNTEFMKMQEELFFKYLNNQCSPEEVKQLLCYFNVDDNEEVLRELISASLLNADTDDDESQWKPALNESFAVIKKQLQGEKAKIIPVSKRSWFRTAAAAVILGGILTAYTLLKTNKEQSVARVENTGKEVNPGSNKA